MSENVLDIVWDVHQKTEIKERIMIRTSTNVSVYTSWKSKKIQIKMLM